MRKTNSVNVCRETLATVHTHTHTQVFLSNKRGGSLYLMLSPLNFQEGGSMLV